MASTKSAFSLLMAFLPIAFCAGLVFYFMSVPGRLTAMVGLPEEATSGVSTQLGPTVIGIGAIGLLFAFAFVLKLVRTASRASPAAQTVELEDDEPFDADAALARYMARKAAGEITVDPAPDAPAVAPLGFGRKSA